MQARTPERSLPPGAASPSTASGTRWNAFWELESADDLAMLPQNSAKPGGSAGAGGQKDAVQEALSALKLGVQPALLVLLLFM